MDEHLTYVEAVSRSGSAHFILQKKKPFLFFFPQSQGKKDGVELVRESIKTNLSIARAVVVFGSR